MDNSPRLPAPNVEILPPWLKSVVTLMATVIAAILYAYILGGAVVRTVIEGQPQFPDIMAKAAGLLSGLMGAVVTAGFAQSRAPNRGPVRQAHVMGGTAQTAWTSLRPPSRVQRKFLGLARTIGLRWGTPTHPDSSHLPQATDDVTEGAPEEGARGISIVTIMGIVYFMVYFLFGAPAFLLAITRSSAPEIISSSGWVWLGTVVSATYTFFALDS